MAYNSVKKVKVLLLAVGIVKSTKVSASGLYPISLGTLMDLVVYRQ